MSRRRRRLMRRDPVQSVTLLLTRDCNLSCRYCRRDRRRRAAMPATVLQRALEVALDLAGDELTVELSGGEPLLAPARLGEALARLAEVRRDGPRVERRLQTNGLGLDDAMLATFVAHDVALDVSCDGPHGQAQRGPGTFTALDRTLRRIRRRHPDYWRRRVAVAVVVAPATVRYLGETVAYFLALGVPRIALAPACGAQARWGRAVCAELARQLAVVYDQAVAHRRCTGAAPLRYLSADPALEPGGETAAVCGAGLRRSFVVDADGSVHGCVQLARAAGWRLPVAVARLAAALAFGNVADPGFATRWRRAGAPADRLPVLRSRVGWTQAGRRCAECPGVAACSVCPLGGPVPGEVPDAHCLFARTVRAQRQRFLACDPLAVLLRAGGLDGELLQRAQGWLRAAQP